MAIDPEATARNLYLEDCRDCASRAHVLNRHIPPRRRRHEGEIDAAARTARVGHPETLREAHARHAAVHLEKCVRKFVWSKVRQPRFFLMHPAVKIMFEQTGK